MSMTGVNVAKSHEFPTGLRVLAVDDDRLSLMWLEKLLKNCGYQVTLAQSAIVALELLREKSDNYDLIISDVRMPDMDGFKLLEIVGLEMDLPVIMLSVDSDPSTVIKGIEHGACDYLVKPARLEDIKIIWKHLIKKSMNDPRDTNETGNSLRGLRTKRQPDRGKEVEDESNNMLDDDISSKKRSRVSWSTDLHARFIEAVQTLGVDRAVPKKILDFMKVPDLTRENVASHLQKYRKALKKNALLVNQHNSSQDRLAAFGANRAGHTSFFFGQEHPQNLTFSERTSISGFQGRQRAFSFGQLHLSPASSSFSPYSHIENNLQPYMYSLNPQVRQVGGTEHRYGLDAVPTEEGLRHEVNNVRYWSSFSDPNQIDGLLAGLQSVPLPLGGNFNVEPISFLAAESDSGRGDPPKDGFQDTLEAMFQSGGARLEVADGRDNLQSKNPCSESSTNACPTELLQHRILDLEANFEINHCGSADDLHASLKCVYPSK